MTWMFDIASDKSKMDVYDATGQLITTKHNDGRGLHIPEDIKTVMRDEAEKARSNDNMRRWRDIYIQLADGDIAPKE